MFAYSLGGCLDDATLSKWAICRVSTSHGQPKGQATGMPRFVRPFLRAHGSLVVFYWMTISTRRFTVSLRWHDAATAMCTSPRGLESLQALGMELFCMVSCCIPNEQLTFAWEPAREDAYRRPGCEKMQRGKDRLRRGQLVQSTG